MERFKTLKDHVYEYIEEQIRSGGLLPDHRIDENVICKELNISRTPVREAFIQLAAEGILENKARKGFVVKAVEKESLSQSYEVIGILDGYAARLACDNLTDKDIMDMQFYVDSADIAINSGNFDMYHKLQLQFHDVYTKKSGNFVLVDTIETAKRKNINMPYRDDAEGKTKEILLATNEEHREILRLFKEKAKEELFEYVSKVHWNKAYAEIDAHN